MSRREPTRAPAASPGAPVFWKSLEEKHSAEGDALAAAELPFGLTDESPKGFVHSEDLQSRFVREDDPRLEGLAPNVSRRGFFKFGTAATALLGLEGCVRRPEEKLLPYSKAPEYTIPGISSHFATTIAHRGEAVGLIVESHEGRPTKIEGNPDHPSSLGGTDLGLQAAIWDLYDPDRSRTVMGPGAPDAATKSPLDMAQFEAAFASLLKKAESDKGAKLRFLMEPTISPTEIRLRQEVKRRFPSAQFHVYGSVTDLNAKRGAQLVFGKPLHANVDFARAKVILSLDSDFLHTETGSIRAAKLFADGRRLKSPSDTMNRLYVAEANFTVTGASADHRLRMRSSDIERYARLLAKSLGVEAGSLNTEMIPPEWVSEVAQDLKRFHDRAAIVVGAKQPPVVHALAYAINAALGSQVVTYSPVADEEELALGDLKTLAKDMADGKVDTLVILGGNPVYSAPGDLKFADALAKVKNTVHLASHYDETSRRSSWHVPMAHGLEAWGDAHSTGGVWSIQQPMIAPLFGGRSIIELLNLAVGPHADGVFRTGKAYDRVRETLFAAYDGPEVTFEKLWKTSVQNGFVVNTVRAPLTVTTPNVSDLAKLFAKGEKKTGYEVVFAADAKLGGGAQGNNAWLLELPDPMTRISWDNAALMSAKTAKDLGLHFGEEETGGARQDVIELTIDGRKTEAAIYVQPGHADGSITLSLGWGRSVGRYATAKDSGERPPLNQTPHFPIDAAAHEQVERQGRGFNASPLRSFDSLGFIDGVQVQKTGRTFALVKTQSHHSMEGRPIAIYEQLEKYRTTPNFPAFKSPSPRTLPLWKPQDYSKGYKWGLNIDLTTCTGCNACVIACQSENNIPIVGKDQVRRGREMLWLRIDRYFVGDDENPKVAVQPVACVQCEQAPCENVCPVNATEHSPEGLNDMAYNRCIGTRYCANNCPYKVRRFNYLEFQGDPMYGDVPETTKMQFNPNVTVRMRGVIEKCTYCVQRIQEAKIGSKRSGKAIQDGEFTTACAQACPSQAISFGNLNDTNAKVTQAAKRDRNYELLAEIGTHPRTSYLGKILNPNPQFKDAAYEAVFPSNAGKEHG
ncbi:MAG: 4Fe-4S dicluster domain-containing protein [Polyangiaceae bacterium]|nr:4Fe-4S dicluster domain-containing protein [Polyangiaceae bacterium]